MMKLTDKQKKVVDIIQWVCIFVLLIICIGGSLTKNNKPLVNDIEYQKEQTYVKIYESQNIESLKKENKILYDSIKKLSDVESAIEIKYIYKYVTDTIKEKEFVYNDKDSVYHYEQDNDTITLEIDVKAKELEWMKNKFTIKDDFMIVNREKDGINQTLIHHSPNSEINEVTTWHKQNKTKWYNNFHIGVQMGVGYGLINNKPDFFIGAGVSYTIK